MGAVGIPLRGNGGPRRMRSRSGAIRHSTGGHHLGHFRLGHRATDQRDTREKTGRRCIVSHDGSGAPPGVPTETTRAWRRMLADEREAAGVYRELAARRDGEERDILLGLAAAEERHAVYWESLLGERDDRPRRRNLRARILGLLARRLR